MWSVFLFVRKWALRCLVLFAVLLVAFVPCDAAEGHASFASLLAGNLSPKGLGGFYSTPARHAEPAYGVAYYWMDEVDVYSWSLSLEFGNDAYRACAFVAYQSMDSLYRNLYSEISFAKNWAKLVVGMSYGLGMEWVPGDAFWTRHRFKWAASYRWKQIVAAGMLSGFMDEGVSHLSPIVGVHWDSDESVSAFSECDFDYLYVGASFRWKFLEVATSYRFPDFAVAVQLSFNGGRYGVSYARGFKHNSLGWNGVHVSRWLKQ